jgi:hypothetical protein
MPSKYANYTKEELIEEQNLLRIVTGENIGGALGGLPVVEQTQEFFVVFDEAGSTGPEIIDKTQFRISYLVDSQLNTSKPVEGQPAAFNATQNFGKSEECIVRADNATVLNQNLTGKQSIYDIGALALISTTEYGKSNDEYITTMSFNTVGGQTVGSAQNLTSKFKTQDFGNPNQLEEAGSLTAQFGTTITAISSSTSGENWISFINDSSYFINADTTVAGTRLRFIVNGKLKCRNLYYGDTVSGEIEIVLIPGSGASEEILASAGTSFQYTGPIGPPQTKNFNVGVITPYRNFFQDDQIIVRLKRTDIGSVNASTSISLIAADVNSVQETPPGDVLIIGVNACTSSYWSGFETVGDSLDLTQNYSILTASQDFTIFTDGTYIQRMSSDSAGFDPENDGNTFNPIQTALPGLLYGMGSPSDIEGALPKSNVPISRFLLCCLPP